MCDDQGLLLILDEIQTGLGRTGTLFAQENFGVTPDVMTLAKALANGLPMGALLATAEVAAAFVPGTHASTFGAGPVVAAAANAALTLLSAPEFLAAVRARGAFLAQALSALQAEIPGHQRGAGPGPHVGPGIDPGRRAGGGRLPGAGPVAQLHPGQRHPAAAAPDHHPPGTRRGPGNPPGRSQGGLSMTRHLLTILDLSRQEIEHLLARARELKVFHKQGQNPAPLKGKTLAMIFDKPSTRTRVSFEAGIAQLGGASIYLAPGQTQMSRNEPVADTARVLSRYVDGVVVRTFAQETVAELARHSTIPVINGLTDTHHPCQVLSDLMTMQERFGNLTGLKVAWVGDGNNMANSWITAAMHLDFPLHLACPPGYEPDAALLAQARQQGARVYLGHDPAAAVADARVINTDVWASMGQEDEAAARLQAFQPFQVNSRAYEKSRPRGHRAPLPAGPPGRGNHRRSPGRPPIRRLGPGRKPPPLPEGPPGMAAGVRTRDQI